MYITMYICKYLYVDMYTIRIHIYICTYTHIYICTYTYIHACMV